MKSSWPDIGTSMLLNLKDGEALKLSLLLKSGLSVALYIKLVATRLDEGSLLRDGPKPPVFLHYRVFIRF